MQVNLGRRGEFAPSTLERVPGFGCAGDFESKVGSHNIAALIIRIGFL